MITGCYTIR